MYFSINEYAVDYEKFTLMYTRDVLDDQKIEFLESNLNKILEKARCTNMRLIIHQRLPVSCPSLLSLRCIYRKDGSLVNDYYITKGLQNRVQNTLNVFSENTAYKFDKDFLWLDSDKDDDLLEFHPKVIHNKIMDRFFDLIFHEQRIKWWCRSEYFLTLVLEGSDLKFFQRPGQWSCELRVSIPRQDVLKIQQFYYRIMKSSIFRKQIRRWQNALWKPPHGYFAKKYVSSSLELF